MSPETLFVARRDFNTRSFEYWKKVQTRFIQTTESDKECTSRARALCKKSEKYLSDDRKPWEAGENALLPALSDNPVDVSCIIFVKQSMHKTVHFPLLWIKFGWNIFYFIIFFRSPTSRRFHCPWWVLWICCTEFHSRKQKGHKRHSWAKKGKNYLGCRTMRKHDVQMHFSIALPFCGTCMCLWKGVYFCKNLSDHFLLLTCINAFWISTLQLP